jgi:hypothetical protein
MWKTIVLCASLFASAALGLVTAARWLEPAVLPVAAAIALCLIGVVLILISPTPPVESRDTIVELPLGRQSVDKNVMATATPRATLH